MSYENVKLWFAKNKQDEIITIADINEENKNSTYNCPVCGSELKPKAIKSKQVTSHFAHVDSSKCSSESLIHFWYKNKFIERGDVFKIISDKEREYICKEVLVEQSYTTSEDKIYNPDVTVITECGNTIYFEMAFSNKKKIKDYLDIWLELKNIVVEIDIKQLMFRNSLPSFKALFYEGKCFNTKRNDIYYNTIGRYKEKKLLGNVDEKLKERIRKLDWFWDDILRYRNDEVNIEYMALLINEIKKYDYSIVEKILKKSICSNLYMEYDRYMNRDNTYYFDTVLEKDSIIRKAVSKLNRLYKKVDHSYKVRLGRETNYYKDTVWWKGRKMTVNRVSSYEYAIILEHELHDSYYYLEKINITNRILEMKEVNDIVEYIDVIMSKHKIKRKCVNCDENFVINFDEVKFYKNKEFDLPKRCKSCRNNRKQRNKEENIID
ncbi:zinc-ribbon domain containing protein [Metabacillus fastidiosus]|uniref:zinc-ribbon domain containing protein n=1 Tax=Metabacillus fastidiosus TaxID=1458 RepID=UPI003D2C6EDD